MSRSTRFFARIVSVFLSTIVTSSLLLGQTAPNLGSAASYGAFTGVGAVDNTGLTRIVGDIGTDAGSISGFPPGVYTGARHVADAQSLAAKADLTTAYSQMGNIPCDAVLSVTMGSGMVLTSQTYCAGGASTINGTLTLDAQGNPNAVFIIKVDGALDVAAGSQIILANLAQASNVYWRVNGAVSILANSIFKGTIVANGAISLTGGASLDGRALSVVGAVTMASNAMSLPVTPAPSSLTVVRPALGDTLITGTLNYRVQFVGVNVTYKKTLEYSLDSGATWSLIGTFRNDSSSYGWNVPATPSTRALVRITDSNGVRGISGKFVIRPVPPVPSLIVVRPATGETLIAGTQNYRIEFTGVNITRKKTIEYSLDSGSIWNRIAIISNDSSSYGWTVPAASSTKAFIRITDSNGVVGRSGVFTIRTDSVPPVASLLVVRPAAGEFVAGGTQNYRVQFVGTGVSQQKVLEYSLDGGTTWNPIATISNDSSSYGWNVPMTPTTSALVRITDSNGVRGTSGMFSITTMPPPPKGTIDTLILTGVVAGQVANNMPVRIGYAYTPDIGTSVSVEYSLDGGNYWAPIATVPTSTGTTTSIVSSVMWTTPASGTYERVFIRVRSTLGMERISDAFRISAPIAGVLDRDDAHGYSIMNFPNPASDATTIRFILPVQSTVTLSVADGLGRQVGQVTAGSFDAGTHSVRFDVSHLAAGIYTYTLETGGHRVTSILTVVK
ncbi:MAG: ice-binding family protein [Candidatus Kapaibacterium sp.]